MKRVGERLQLVALLAVVVAGVYYVRFGDADYQQAAFDRKHVAGTSAGPIELAVVWPQGKQPDSFVRGVQLAVSEINRRGGVLTDVKNADGNSIPQARQLAVRFFDEPSVDAGVAVARYIAAETGIVAVIGHNLSAVPASIVYNTSGVLYIAPANLNPELTRHGFDNVFSIAPHVTQIAHAMVDEVEKIIANDEVRLAVLYPEGFASPENLVSRLNQASERVNPKMKVSFKVFPLLEYPRPSLLQDQTEAEFQKQSNFRKKLVEFVDAADRYELVLIADVQPDAARIRQQLEQEFASRPTTSRKRILDLGALNWSSVRSLYADFTSGNSNALFDQIVRLVLDEARQNVAIIASRDANGETLGATIWSTIYDRMDDPTTRLRMELYRSYFPKRTSMMQITSEVLAKQPEAVFLATTGTQAIALIRRLRLAGYAGTVMCPPGLEADLNEAAAALKELEPQLPAVAATGAGVTQREHRGRTFFVTPFNLKGQGKSEKVAKFVQRFNDAHKGENGEKPPLDGLAATGYFSIHLLKDALNRGRSAWPQTIAASLLQFEEQDGILGSVSFVKTSPDYFEPQTTHDLQGLKMYLSNPTDDR